MSQLITQNLVLDFNAFTGTAYDFSGNNGVGTILGQEGFLKTEDGYGFSSSNGSISSFNRTSAIRYDYNDIQNLDACCITIRIDGVSSSNMGGLLGKFGSYQFVLGYVGYFLGYLVLEGSGPTYSYLHSSNIPTGTRTLSVRKAAGISVPEFYADGVFIGNGANAIQFGTSSNPLIIANSGVGTPILNVDQPVQSVVIRNSEGSAEQIVLDHKALVSRKTAFKSKRNFYTAPSVGVPSSGSAWNAIVSKGQIIDQGPNHYNGTIYSDIAATQSAGLIPVETPWGEPALGNTKGTGAHINFGAAANVQYSGADTVFGYAQWFKCSSDGAQMLMSRSGNYFLQKISAGNLQLSMGSGAWTVTTSPVRDDVWHLYSFFVDEDYEYIYIDGEEVGKSARTGTPGGGTLRIGQYVITGFDIDGAIGPQVFYRSFSNLAEYQAELKKEWNRVANKVIYEETFSDAHIHNSDISSGPIPGTDWDVLSVGGRIVDGPDLGTKSITSSSAGNSIRTPGVTHTFGVIEIDCTPTSGTRCRHAFSSPGSFSILDVGDSGNGRIAYTTSTGGVVFATANSSSTTDRQTIRIDKKANTSTNNTSIYKDGALLTAATGSNPCTDITNFTVDRQITTYSNAQIHSIKHYFGVPLT